MEEIVHKDHAELAEKFNGDEARVGRCGGFVRSVIKWHGRFLNGKT
jgi:hypothetical protein